MNDQTFRGQRLRSHGLVGSTLPAPLQVVEWFGALQAQDFAGVQLAIGLRGSGPPAAQVVEALRAKEIVRTWLMRGTLHVVSAADLPWLLDLVGPRQIRNSARRYKQLALDDDTFQSCFNLITRNLERHSEMTRDEIKVLLEAAGFPMSGQRIYHILRRTALEGLIHFGVNRDGEDSFVLAEVVNQATRPYDREAALATLALRYFRSHGPATYEDYAWWSGLTARDARLGLTLASPELEEIVINGVSYWCAGTSDADLPDTCFLLPAYDEYYLGYKQRGDILDGSFDSKAVSHNGVFRRMLVINGQILGTWQPSARHEQVEVSILPFKALTTTERRLLQAGVSSYGTFLERPVTLNVVGAEP